MISYLISLLFITLTGSVEPDYSIEAIRYGTIENFPLANLVAGAPEDEKLDIAMVVWLIRGHGRNILLDSGFYRGDWGERFKVKDYIRPDQAVQLAGLSAAEVTDIIVSHAHWDHMGGIDLFPSATIWIQKEEFKYYTGAAWQDGGRAGGIDIEDIVALVRLNAAGKVRLIDGDNIEILPGIRVYTGARHTFASQYVLVETTPPYVLASDNCYLYYNMDSMLPVRTFQATDGPANLAAIRRMVSLAGAAERVIPGHDALQFQRFPTKEPIALIK